MFTPPPKFLPLLLGERLRNVVVVVTVATISTITHGRILRSETRQPPLFVSAIKTSAAPILLSHSKLPSDSSLDDGKKADNGLIVTEHSHLPRDGLEGHGVLAPPLQPRAPEALAMNCSGAWGRLVVQH